MEQLERTYQTLVTDTGAARITAAMVNEEQVQIATLAVGDGGGAYYLPTSSMTALKNEKWRGDINSVGISDKAPNQIDIVAVVPANVGGWTIREMGIFDDIGNLIAICNTPDTEKVIITSGAAGEIELVMHIEVSSTSVISFTIDPNVMTATKKDLENHNASPAAHKDKFGQKADVIDLQAHASNTNIHVTPQKIENYDIAIAELTAHAQNLNIHTTGADKAAWSAGAELAAQASQMAQQVANQAAALESRLARVEDALFSNITGNPFLASFGALSGVTLVKGVWNESRQRIEC